MASKPFVLAHHIPEYDNPLEYDLHNLEMRLRIQKRWVADTEKQIEDLKERIENEKISG
jgi:hypothetical protein